MGFIFVDLESGGLYSDKNPVLAIGAVATDDDLVVKDEFFTYVKPGEGLIIEPEALAINHITPDLWENAPTEIEVLHKLNNFMNKNDAKVVVGFNVNWDLSFLKSIAFRNKTYFLSSGWSVDVQQLVKDVYDCKKYSLKSTCAFFDVTNHKAHTALGDAYATLEIARKVML